VSAEQAELAEEEHDRPHGDTGEHAHPTEAVYIRIAVILAALTAIEVGLYYTNFNQQATNGALLVLAATKFVMVAAYFMHLKFDNRVLRRLFVSGFVLATFCYLAYLSTLGVFRFDFLPWS
jgi:cytochrome c oxidase subunit IV